MKYFPIYALSLALLWAGCNCPPNEQVGDLSLGDPAKAFLPYDGSETLTFVDETGANMAFTLPRGQETFSDQLCIRTICTEAKFNSPSSCEYYAAESRRFSFFSDGNEAVLDLLLYSDVYNYNSTDFYDALQVAFSIGTPSIEAGAIVEQRFTGDFVENETSVQDFFVLTPTLTLNSRDFTDVLVYEEGNLGVYVQEGVGVIGFKNAEHTWVLE